MSDFSEKSDSRYGTGDVTAGTVRTALRADLAECRLSRGEVALQLSARAGRKISLAVLDAFASETHPHRFPLELVPAWIAVTGSRRLLELIAGEAGLWLGTQDDQELAELSRLTLRRERLADRLRGRV